MSSDSKYAGYPRSIAVRSPSHRSARRATWSRTPATSGRWWRWSGGGTLISGGSDDPHRRTMMADGQHPGPALQTVLPWFSLRPQTDGPYWW